MGGHGIPVSELFVELLHVLLPLPLVVLALPPLFQDGGIVVHGASVVIDAVLLRRTGGRSLLGHARRDGGHEGLLDGRTGLLRLGPLDGVRVVEVGCWTGT